MAVALQADLVVASIFVFEKAVALGSYWLSEGVVRPGWAALLAAVHSMEVSKHSAGRAVRHVKRIQTKVVRAGSWLFGVRDGDMVTALMEHRPSWGLLGLLLPITALLSPEQAATVLVEISNESWLLSAEQDQTALIPRKRYADVEDMSFETAHNIIAAATPYVGHGYDSKEYNKILETILTSFPPNISGRLAAACAKRPTGHQVADMLKQIAASSGPEDHIVIVTGHGFDVLSWIASTVLDCKVTLQVGGKGVKLAEGGSRSVTVVFSPNEAPGAFRYKAAGLYSGASDDADPTGANWAAVETRWTLSNYLQLRMQAWELGQDAKQDLETVIVDQMLHRWWHGHIYAHVGQGINVRGLRSPIEHNRSNEPPGGFPLKDLISPELLVARIACFDNQFAEKIAERYHESSGWKRSVPPRYDLKILANYCPCYKHNGPAATKAFKSCICHIALLLCLFVSKALSTMSLISIHGKTDSDGIPVNCGASVQELVGRLPDGRHGGELLHFSVVLESASLLLGTYETGIQATSAGVIGVAAFGCGLIPGILITTSVSPVDNISLVAMAGRLFCRGVAVNALKSTSWADGPFTKGNGVKEGIQIVSADNWESTVVARPSEVTVEATMEAGVGHIALRVDWTSEGADKHEYVGVGDTLLGISCALIASCDHEGKITGGHGDLVIYDAEHPVNHGGTSWEKLTQEYAEANGIEIKEYYNGYKGVVVPCGGDRGRLLRALRYGRTRQNTMVRQGDACLHYAIELAHKMSALVILTE